LNSPAPSPEEGIRWLERAATQGFVEAQARLAWVYVQGLARAKAPDASAQARPAASLFSDAEPAREPDFETAIGWARRAAKAGSADGQVALAYILTSGPEALRDLEEAHRWYEKAASSGSPQGALGYALSLARLARSEDDQKHMVAQLRRAADQGLPTALYLMGVLTDGGVGTDRDPVAAALFYRQAAEKGSRNGQARWGWR
jgi:TPR repeat protein